VAGRSGRGVRLGLPVPDLHAAGPAELIIKGIPQSIRVSITRLGLFLALIALKTAGVVAEPTRPM
jgi:xanthine/uracil/vitamin C permease (AzgA family)